MTMDDPDAGPVVYSAELYISCTQSAFTPSRNNDIDSETEMQLRVFGCELIQEAGILLKLYPIKRHRFTFYKWSNVICAILDNS